MSRYSVETLDEAREALRRLSSEVSAFRSPAVQQHLSSPSDSTTNPALQAQIIALRTKLDDLSQLHNTSKQQLHSAQKRAANAEARVNELEAELQNQQFAITQLELSAADRIKQLETDKKQHEIVATQTASALRGTVERNRLAYPAVVAQRDQLEAVVARLKEDIVVLGGERDSLHDKLQFHRKCAQREQDRLRKKAEDLEAELKFIRSEIEKSSRKDSSHLEPEVKRLRKLVIEMERQDVKSRRELDNLRSKATKLQGLVDVAKGDKERLAALECEVRGLRVEKEQVADLAKQAKMLMKEREQMIALVSGLSETGNVQEGLAILSNAAGGKPLDAKRDIGRRRDVGSHDSEVERHQKEIEDTRSRESEAVNRLRMEIGRLEQEGRTMKMALQRAESDRDAALESSRSSERVRRILQVENRCFKDALEGIEKEFDKPADPDGSVTRLRERCAAYEETTTNYQRTITQMEGRLREAHAEVGKIKAELLEVKNAKNASASGSDRREGMIRDMWVASGAGKGAMDAQSAAEDKGQGVSGGERTAREQPGTSKVVDSNSVEGNESGEPDYNPSEVKVLHVKDNLFRKAVHEAEIAADVAKGKKRLRMAVESGSSPLRDSAMQLRMEALVKEVEELTAKNASLEQRSKVGIRTGEIAKKKIEEVRSAVYNLFGWTMNIMGAKYTIASAYAESPDEIFEFGVNKLGTMSLMETEYAKEMAKEIETYVKNMHSIPALLGHITMQNFEKTTVLY